MVEIESIECVEYILCENGVAEQVRQVIAVTEYITDDIDVSELLDQVIIVEDSA